MFIIVIHSLSLKIVTNAEICLICKQLYGFK